LLLVSCVCVFFFFFQAEDGIRDLTVTGVQTCALPIYIPLELGSTRDISALTIGLVLLPQAIGTAITMPIGGRLTDRIGARGPVRSEERRVGKECRSRGVT